MQKGAVAAGHLESANAGAEILRAGGNAFDAALSAFLASCVCEPTYVSVGGGGFMLAHSASGKTVLYDFFAQTPAVKRPPHELDFRKVTLHFGGNTQDFHIGLGAVAVPGNVAGLFYIHQHLGRLPFAEIAAPALQLAKNGVALTPFIQSTIRLLAPILTDSADGKAVFTNKDGEIKSPPETIFIPYLYDALYALSKEGARLFYEGEIGQQLVADCAEKGGYITAADLKNYRVIERKPIQIDYHGQTLFTNPPPCTGGALIAFALQLLQRLNMAGKVKNGSANYMQLMAQVFYQTNLARKHEFDKFLHHPQVTQNLLHPQTIERYALPVANLLGNTTHISAADAQGNVASLTHSSGAGSNYYIPNTGMMLNNMLGEADLNPHGFHRWAKNRRLSSMMSPTLMADAAGTLTALGSSGSSRIRSALVQVISHIEDYKMPLEEAVNMPRLHLENRELNIEYGFNADEATQLQLPHGWHKVIWQQQSMYFGGVNAVAVLGNGIFSGAADMRRSGACIVV
ncbi:gamma-glutamyltransferase [Sphingobacteriales bacterium UPWRP_1]|nr:gamma-glutamyltransferase [Sphingobacteriales bacterium TSM_CSS]PSJ79030.1 gamma-glutamyltransferase [Sphingobacteriales bacterium UPWRP_1]